MQIKTLRLFMAAAVLFSLSACNNDEILTDPFADGPVAMTFTADINSVATRATGTGFEEGDVVGIIPVKGGSVETQANIAYTYQDGKFTTVAPEEPYWFQNTDPVTFNAYYPHREITPEQGNKYQIVIYTDKDNQTEIARKQNDILFATKDATVRDMDNDGSISYTGEYAFKHVMSQLTLTFTAGNGITDLETLQAYTLGELIQTATFDLGEGNLIDFGTPVTTGLTVSVVGTKQSSITADPLILLPQPIETKKIPLTVRYNGQNYNTNLILPDAHDGLQAGTHYTFEVTISNTGLAVGSATITDWVPATGKTDGEATLQ